MLRTSAGSVSRYLQLNHQDTSYAMMCHVGTGQRIVGCGVQCTVVCVPLMGDIGHLPVSRIQECCDSMHRSNLVFCTNQLTSHDFCTFANLGQLMLVRCMFFSMFQKVLTPPDNHSDGGWGLPPGPWPWPLGARPVGTGRRAAAGSVRITKWGRGRHLWPIEAILAIWSALWTG